jgi:hypothetical protein
MVGRGKNHGRTTCHHHASPVGTDAWQVGMRRDVFWDLLGQGRQWTRRDAPEDDFKLSDPLLDLAILAFDRSVGGRGWVI